MKLRGGLCPAGFREELDGVAEGDPLMQPVAAQMPVADDVSQYRAGGGSEPAFGGLCDWRRDRARWDGWPWLSAVLAR